MTLEVSSMPEKCKELAHFLNEDCTQMLTEIFTQQIYSISQVFYNFVENDFSLCTYYEIECATCVGSNINSSTPHPRRDTVFD